MEAILQTLSNVFALCFIVGSMVSLGLSLYLWEIIAPLKNWSLVWRMMLVNFVLVPGLAYLITIMMSLDSGYAIGLVLVGAAAGAPFIPKLIELARGDVAKSVGVMVLLMVSSVVYLPIVLPMALPNVQINPMAIAQNLVLLMLLPLAISLFIHSRYQRLSAEWQPAAARIANVGLGGTVIALIVNNIEVLENSWGTGLILACALFIVGAFIIGMLFAKPQDRDGRALYGFSASQRNVAAAMVVSTQSFSDQPEVTVVVVVMAIALNVILLLAASEWGKHTKIPVGAVPMNDIPAGDIPVNDIPMKDKPS